MIAFAGAVATDFGRDLDDGDVFGGFEFFDVGGVALFAEQFAQGSGGDERVAAVAGAFETNDESHAVESVDAFAEGAGDVADAGQGGGGQGEDEQE